MRHTVRIIIVLSIAVSVPLLWLNSTDTAWFKQAGNWQQFAEPGPLSAAHAHLQSNCAACHTPVKGVQAANCIVCHANNESILQRQPTAFHASISSCKECHQEHQGRATRPTSMNHIVLASIGLDQLTSDDNDTESAALHNQLVEWAERAAAPHPRIAPQETVLDCAACHSRVDRHFTLFGQDCAQCHATDTWMIPEFRHPSPSSTDCSQCHQAPPSHYMMHFQMISVRVAGKPHARLDQCFECHQTTSWNDIRGVGWYKHH